MLLKITDNYMLDKIIKVFNVPSQYRPLAAAGKIIGEKLGDAIGKGWDNLVDALLSNAPERE